MRKTLFIPALIAAALAGGTALAQPPGGQGHGHHTMTAALDQLDLSDTQWLAIHKLMQAQRGKHEGHERHRGGQGGIEAINPDSPDYARQVQAAQDQAADAARSHVARAAEFKKQIYAVLTPEQKTKLAALREKHHGHRQG